MKFFLLSSLIAVAGASSSSDRVALRGSENLSSGRAELLAKWEGLAAEAEYIQIAIKEGRTYNQCKNGCEDAKRDADDDGRKFNRGRCIKDCGEIDDEGNSSNTRSQGCGDCKTTFKWGSNKYDRCMQGCRAGQSSNVDACSNARTCADCRRDCGNGIFRDDCLDCNDCPGRPGNQCFDFGNNDDNGNDDNGFDDNGFDDNNDDNNNDDFGNGNRSGNRNCSNSFCNCDNYSGNKRNKCLDFRGTFSCCGNEDQPKEEQPVKEE